MNKFMQTHKVYLTPLSPIHIGCGEDFVPTNYVIDENTLFHFEPSNLSLNDQQRTELLNFITNLDLLAIQRFFLNLREQAIASAYYFTDVSEGLAKNYREKIGKVAQRENNSNKIVVNQFAIERTAYQPFKQLPYIPGSSFKGALATALLDKAHQEKHNPKVGIRDNGKLLKAYLGEFENSQLRTVKFGDFLPIVDTESKIFYALNFKKKPSKTGGEGRAMALRRECISAGQYRAYCSELTLMANPENKQNITDYFKALRDFYLPIFKEEVELLKSRHLSTPNYLKSLENLLNNPKVALIRLGKNGADSKTYQGKGIAQIKIMGAKGTPPNFKDSPTTIWLAGSNDRQQTDLLPFGWALLEYDPQEENSELKAWCNTQPKSSFDRSAILVKREEQKVKQAKLKAEAEAKLQAEKEAELAKIAMLNSLNENQKIIIDFVEKVENTRERQADNTGSPLLKEAQKLFEQALSWQIQDRQFVCEKITVDLLRSKIDFKKKDTEKTIKKWINKLVS
ncbi:RAMP superfamily CRISPR-associated protein [Actinobacillus genomosp. 1]|uniref:RAMP superfamily CRISPR-associated protein n=1 Tax=Actinobacillus genomosp. 1 TaxID=254839 RepID=UPI0024426A2E|nr:RAMP superfamily CRISPR-associated protein [Actinobacillus genomosp. 1]WGE91138.1 RAMP superfamily CRISPR-associated protein [Actinobacillus genomosp. 1]